jgi:hypothetical protein
MVSMEGDTESSRLEAGRNGEGARSLERSIFEEPRRGVNGEAERVVSQLAFPLTS